MTALPVQKRTADYGKFDMHVTNRVVHDESGFKPRKDLLASMKEQGFLPQAPIVCQKQTNGRLLIIDGHNRFVTAMSLGLPVDYLAYEPANIDPAQFSRNQVTWKVDDYVSAYVHQDLDDYVEVDEFCQRTGITRNAAAAMFTNNLPSSNNNIRALKSGALSIKCRDFPEKVGMIVIAIRTYVPWSATASCVTALARCVLAEDFDHHLLISKIHKYSEHLKKQPSCDDYMRLFESLYNRNSKSGYYPLAAKANEAVRARARIFQRSAT